MTEFRVQRVVAKPVEDVWTAFTDTAALAAWFWPPGCRCGLEDRSTIPSAPSSTYRRDHFEAVSHDTR
jgi:Uncharacterized conserved protein